MVPNTKLKNGSPQTDSLHQREGKIISYMSKGETRCSLQFLGSASTISQNKFENTNIHDDAYLIQRSFAG